MKRKREWEGGVERERKGQGNFFSAPSFFPACAPVDCVKTQRHNYLVRIRMFMWTVD